MTEKELLTRRIGPETIEIKNFAVVYLERWVENKKGAPIEAPELAVRCGITSSCNPPLLCYGEAKPNSRANSYTSRQLLT
jgi:hypothetical protein